MKLIPTRELQRLLGDKVYVSKLYVAKGKESNGQTVSLHLYYVAETKIQGKEVELSESITLLCNIEHINWVILSLHILQRVKHLSKNLWRE